MARVRDYKAEYAARKARARAEGYASPRRIKPKPKAPVSKKQSQANTRAKSAGYKSDYDYRKNRRKARKSSDAMAMHNSAMYAPETRPKGMTIPQYTKAYNGAWNDRSRDSRKTKAERDARLYWYQGMWDEYPDSDPPDWYVDDFDDKYGSD